MVSYSRTMMNTKKMNMEKNKKALEQYRMYIPAYLENYVKDVQENRLIELSLCSTAGNELFEIWYYGDLFEVQGEEQACISQTEMAPEKIVARDVITGEEIVIHDGALHGYDNMFCDEYDAEAVQNRPLKKYSIPASRLIVELGYGIDYEEEKEEYDIDDKGLVTLIDGRKMSWEDVKRNGIDYIAVFFENEKGNRVQFYDKELA